MNEQGANDEPRNVPPVRKRPPPLPIDDDLPLPDDDESLGLPLNRRDTAALVLLTFLADVCLYRTWGGTGGATLMLGTMTALLALKGKALTAQPLTLALVVLALAGVLVWSAWWLAVVLAVVSIFRLAIRIWKPEWDMVESLCAVAYSAVAAPQRLYGHWVSSRANAQTTERRSFPARLIVIPVAVTVVFLFVFALANPVLSDQFSKLGNHIGNFLMRLQLIDYLSLWRFTFWCGWLLIFAALIRPVIYSAFIDHLRSLAARLSPCDITPGDELNFLVARITLICVNIVFLGYNCVDAIYLYGKASLPEKITWTAYTHAGCGWLTFGLFLSTVALGFVFWRELNFHPRTVLLKRLAYVWIVQNAVLAIGTLRRIDMYIDYSGLTHLLLTGIYGSLLVMVGLIIMAVKVRGNHSAIWLLRNYVSAFVTGLTVLALTPQGWVCAHYNVPRIQAMKSHATWPIILKDLPADALPVIIPLLDYKRPDGDTAKERLVREGIAGILGQNLVRLETEAHQPWTQWQASSWWALKHLRPNLEKIESMVPPSQWQAAHDRLKADYDLSGDPVQQTDYRLSH